MARWVGASQQLESSCHRVAGVVFLKIFIYLFVCLFIHSFFSSDCAVEFNRNSATPVYQILSEVLGLQVRYSLTSNKSEGDQPVATVQGENCCARADMEHAVCLRRRAAALCGVMMMMVGSRGIFSRQSLN